MDFPYGYRKPHSLTLDRALFRNVWQCPSSSRCGFQTTSLLSSQDHPGYRVVPTLHPND
jgi:hypothetical protein